MSELSEIEAVLQSANEIEVNRMNNVTNGNFNTRFSVQEDLEHDLSKLIEKYDGQMSLAQFCGVLDIVKFSLLAGHSE